MTSLRQKGTQQPLWGKVFVGDASGVRPYLVLDKQPPDPPPPPPGLIITNPYNLVAIDVSGDGRELASTGITDCYNGNGICIYRDPLVATLSGGSSPTKTFPGTMHLSANGKYGLTIEPADPVGGNIQRIDLTTGSNLSGIPGFYLLSLPDNGRVVTNDGTAILSYKKQLVALRDRGSETLPTAPGEQVGAAGVSADGSLAVFEASSGSSYSLNVFALATGEERVLWPGRGWNATISNDGSKVLFLANDENGASQAYLIGSDGTGLRALTDNYAGIQNAVLSGDGTACYVVTKAGRVFRLDTASLESRQLVGRTPVASGLFNSWMAEGSPGALISVSGAGLAELRRTAAAVPLPNTLAGFRITYNGTALPIFRVAPDEVWLQLPWDLAGDAATNPAILQIETDASDALFETPSLRILVRPNLGGFEADAAGTTIAAHSNFASLVTTQNPARPGEIVHFYSRGLGPVDPLVPIGQPAPANPPAQLVTPLQCAAQYTDVSSTQVSSPVNVLFAGPAPGLVGYYQVSVQLPTFTVTADEGLVCNVGQAPGSTPWGTIPMSPQ